LGKSLLARAPFRPVIIAFVPSYPPFTTDRLTVGFREPRVKKGSELASIWSQGVEPSRPGAGVENCVFLSSASILLPIFRRANTSTRLPTPDPYPAKALRRKLIRARLSSMMEPHTRSQYSLVGFVVPLVLLFAPTINAAAVKPYINSTAEYSTECKTCPHSVCTNKAYYIGGDNFTSTCWTRGTKIVRDKYVVSRAVLRTIIGD